MKVTLKFVLVLIVVLFVIRTFEGFLTVKRETERLNTDIQRDALLLGNIITTSVQNMWLSNGRNQAIKLAEKFNLNDHSQFIFHGNHLKVTTASIINLMRIL